MRMVLFLIVIAAALACGPSSSQQQTTTPEQADAATEPVERIVAPVPPEPTYDQVTLTATPYYASSPMQARPPDGEIPAGIPCRVIEGSIGPYAHIQTASGIDGYVGADALGPAPTP